LNTETSAGTPKENPQVEVVDLKIKFFARIQSPHQATHWHNKNVTNLTDTIPTWLSAEDMNLARARLPIVYLDVIPVRVDEAGRITKVGLLLRGRPDGSISRALISGRVLHGERIRDALLRHIEKDLGALALPQLPTNPAPFTVAEYFPDPDVSGFHDPRQHAVSLVYVVPVKGDCAPSQDALDLVWLTPKEAMSQNVRAEMTGGQDQLVQMALAHAGAHS
jgi:ADP-ribose pyrophosphatase YjhB (NUDIX family)